MAIGSLSPMDARVAELSDEELDYLLGQQQQEDADLASLSDEELNALFSTYEAPGGNIAEAPQVAEAPPELSLGEAVAGGARELAGGALFEMSDEAEAAARAAVSKETYEQALREIRQNRARFSEAYPGTATALNIAGGIGSMFVPGAGAAGRAAQAATGISKLGSPLARTAASGALAGGAAGFGSGEGLGGSLENAAIGATLGTGIGAAAHGVGGAGRWVRDVFAARGAEMSEREAAQHAAAIMSRRLEGSGITPEQAAQLLQMEQRYGIPSVIGTVTPELSRLTENVVQTPSGGREELLQRLFSQQAGARERVTGQIRTNIPTPDYFASEDQITGALRRNANTAYERAYAAGDISDGRIMDFLRAPDVQIAYKDALANAERLKEAAKLRGEDPSRYDLRELFVADPQGNIVKQNVPDIRTLDYVKQAMDRRINSLYSSGQGSEATALRDMRNAFVDTLDTVGPPEYRAARRQYKGDIEVRDALEQGRNSSTLRWQQFNKLMGDYTPGEQQAFRTGFVQNVMQQLENPSANRNFARQLIDSDNMRRKMQAVMEPGEFQVFEAALRREAALFDEINRITRGSATFGRQAERTDIEQQIAGGNVETAVDLMLNPTPGNIARRALQAVTRLRDANVSRATYTQLSRMLRAGTPQEVDDVLRQLEEAAPVQRAADQAMERGTTKAAAGAATTVAPSPEIERERTPEDVQIEVPSIDEVAPVSGLSAMPSVGAQGPGGGEGDLYDVLKSIMPGWQNMLGGDLFDAAGNIMEAADVAKALGVPLETWLAYASR